MVDLNRIKLLNETIIAVGNAGVNARGDLVQGSKIVKTREQIAQEVYNIRGNNIAKDAKIIASEADVQADDLSPTEVAMLNAYDEINAANESEPVVMEQKPLADSPRGGLANAVSKSKEIANVLEAQRKRI
jgi:hypothetical protein